MSIVRVAVKPNQRVPRLQRNDDGTFEAWLKASPVDGKANEELIRMFADHLGIPKRSIRIKVGASGRVKLLEIED